MGHLAATADTFVSSEKMQGDRFARLMPASSHFLTDFVGIAD